MNLRNLLAGSVIVGGLAFGCGDEEHYRTDSEPVIVCERNKPVWPDNDNLEGYILFEGLNPDGRTYNLHIAGELRPNQFFISSDTIKNRSPFYDKESHFQKKKNGALIFKNDLFLRESIDSSKIVLRYIGYDELPPEK